MGRFVLHEIKCLQIVMFMCRILYRACGHWLYVRQKFVERSKLTKQYVPRIRIKLPGSNAFIPPID